MANQLELIAKYRERLDRQSEQDIVRLIEAYGLMSERLKDKVDLLLLEIERNPDANIVQMQRYKDLTKALFEEYKRFEAYMETELQTIASKAESQARLDSTSLIAAALLAYGIKVSPKSIPSPRFVSQLLAPGSPHYERLHKLAPLQAQRIIDNLLGGIKSGVGFQRLGKMIVDDLGLGLSDALRWARTVQMETYRETSHNTMLENSGLIDGWTWWAQVDERTCEDCAESHGSFHPASESLTDLTVHVWNCRCVELPHVMGDNNPVTGEGIEDGTG